MGKLNNTYFILRHGESMANVAHILLSNPEEGMVSYGLSEKGREQVKNSVLKIKEEGILGADTIIYSSDFMRTKETAEIAAEILSITKINFHKNLRERYFGNYDKTSLDNLQKVWDDDAKNSDNKNMDVESPNDVLKRVVELIENIEKEYKGCKILLVSHGDVFRMLLTYFEGLPASDHQKVSYLKTGEVRKLL